MGGCEAEASGDGSATGHWWNEHRGGFELRVTAISETWSRFDNRTSEKFEYRELGCIIKPANTCTVCSSCMAIVRRYIKRVPLCQMPFSMCIGPRASMNHVRYPKSNALYALPLVCPPIAWFFDYSVSRTNHKRISDRAA